MKKDISLLFTKSIYLLFIVATIIVCFIVYKDIDNKVAIGFVVGYAIFAFLFLLYIIFTAILNLRKLKWNDIKGRLFKFIISFIIILALGYVFDYFFRSSKIDLFRNLSIAIGTAFGISFNDIIFSKRNKNSKIPAGKCFSGYALSYFGLMLLLGVGITYVHGIHVNLLIQ